MIYVLYGDDEFSLREALDKIKDELSDRESLATNTTLLQGQQLTPEQLSTTCNALPFLAPKRLVIVEGLLSRFEQQDGSKGKRLSSVDASNWHSFKEHMCRIPETTVLVMIDGKLKSDNPILVGLKSEARIIEFRSLKGEELRNWIHSRIEKRGCSISPKALRMLSDLIGSNLQLLSMEIEKLCLYAHGREIKERDVESLVTETKESSVFEMVDAILERRAAEATRLLHRLEDEGAAPSYLLFMITRQFRMVMQAKDLLQQQSKAEDIGHRLGITKDFVLQKTLKQARAYSMRRLKDIYRKLLDADISIKTGQLKGDEGSLALDLLVCELCEQRS